MSDMLKEFRRYQNLEGNEAVRCSRMHFRQWADELESLTARLAAAEAALQPFAKVAADIDPKLEDYMAHHYDHFVGHYRAAAEAAKGGRDE